MSGLKQELGLAQGIGLLSTSLLGTGVFAVPALAALVAGNNNLWAWPVLIILVFPIAIVFAILGRHYPSAGGVAHFVGMAFGSRLERVTGWLFLSVIPVGLPAALQIAAGFGQAMFGWHSGQLLLAGTRHAGAGVVYRYSVPVPVLIYKQLLPGLSSH